MILNRGSVLTTIGTFLGASAFILTVCGFSSAESAQDPVGGEAKKELSGAPPTSAHGKKVAVVTLEPKSGSSARGSVAFYQIPEGLLVEAAIRNVPEGAHGFHVHEKGDCSAPDAASAGGHLNPTHHEHGSPGKTSHLGDLGNLHVGKDKTGTVSLVLKGVKPHSISEIIGKAVVLHEGEDDLKSQPAGNSGKRIACGVVEKSVDTE